MKIDFRRYFDPEVGELRLLNVQEAARLLNTSIANVRRMCSDGTLRAIWSGSYWLVHADAVPGVETVEMNDVDDGVVRDSADASIALDQLQLLDLKEEWVPDILRHEDQLQDRAGVLEEAADRGLSRTFKPPVEVDVPKTSFFCRSGQLLDLADRINFHVLVSSFHNEIESVLSPYVYSARRADPRSPYFLRRGINQWKAWRQAVRRSLRSGNSWLIKSDLSAYFDCVKHDILIRELEHFRGDSTFTADLRRMLDAWSVVPGQGLPQGPDASRVLGNLYLAPVDTQVLDAGFSYFRYMDDVRITGKSRGEVTRGMQLFERACRERGLIASPAKTQLLHGRRARNSDEDSRRRYVDLLLGMKNMSKARAFLKQMLKESFRQDGQVDGREARFSLWRLSMLRDSGVRRRVLSRLSDFGPAASVVADYLTTYIEHPHTVKALTNYLQDSDSQTSNFLTCHLMSAMLEHSSQFPKEWSSAARAFTINRENPVYLRTIAANVMARGKIAADIEWLRREAKRETDERLVRGYIVALKRVNQLDSHLLSVLSSRSFHIRRTLAYLRDATDLPSLTRRDRYLKIDV